MLFTKKPPVDLMVLTAIMFLGFLPSYIGQFTALSTAHHWHGLIAVVWLALINTQARLAHQRNRQVHKYLGWFSFAFSLCLMGSTAGLLLSGLSASPKKAEIYQLIYWVDAFSLLAFGYLIATGYLNRKNPALHRSSMFLTMIILLPPGLGRFIYVFFLYPFDLPLRFLFEPMMLGTLGLLVLFGVREQWRFKHTKIVTLLVGVSFVSAYFFAGSDRFIQAARWLSQSL